MLLGHVAIAGEPAVTVSGTVVDADGKPVPDAEVFLSEGPFINSRMARLSVGQVPVPPQILGHTHSGDAGAFTISLADEIPESYWARTWLVLWVRRSGSALTTYLIGRDWPALAAPVNVRLADAPSLPIVVVAPDGRPLPRVRAQPEELNGLRLPRELAEQLASRSDDAGRAVLRGVAPASLDLVRIETEQYGIQWVSLPAAQSDGVRRIVLAPVGAIRGRLLADDPRAIATVTIRLASWLAPGDDTAGGGLAEAVTDAAGRFEVPAIVAGALSVRLNLHAELAFRCQPIAARPIAEAVTNELTINLERAVRVEGVVRDRESSQPLAGAAVWVDHQSRRGLPRSNAQGRYTGFLLPGQASPSPWGMPRHYYFPAYTLDTQPVPAGSERVELKPLLLARGATLSGRVVGRAGQGVAGAEIEAHWELASGGETSVHAWSNRDGGFTLDGVDPQAQIKLSAASPQGTTAEPVSVAAGAEKRIVVVIDPSQAMQLEGRALDSEKRPVASATVQIAWQRRGADGSAVDFGHVRFQGYQRLFTDADGRFRTPAMLVPGLEYRAEVAASGMLPAMTEFVDPVAWNTGNLGDIVLHDVPEVRTLAGRILDRRGKPIAGLRVFQTGDGPRRTETTTDEHGRFRLAGVYAGTAFVLVSGGDYPLQGFTGQFADRYRIVVARGLAAHDPAAAERMLDELELSAAGQALPVLHRMAAADPQRAARLARKCDSDAERGYALGIVAHGAARHNAAQAAAMLDEAYGWFERASADGGTAYAWDHPAVLAAALLPAAERIDPALVDGYIWRAMALRPPRAARLGADHHFALVTGAMAIFISRYDRDAARVLVEPIAAHIQSLATDGEYWISKLAWGSLVAVDSAWAESLSETLPNPPPRALRAAKNIARRNIADALAPSADSWWHKLYQLSALRDPDARDDD